MLTTNNNNMNSNSNLAESGVAGARPVTSFQSRRTLQKHPSQSHVNHNSLHVRPSTSSAAAGARFDLLKINYKASQQDDIDNGFSHHQSSLHQQSVQSIQQSQLVRMPMIKTEFSSKDLAKTIPKNIPQDKERLYEELIAKKQMINQLVVTNYKLQTQGKTLQQELRRYEKIADSNEMPGSGMQSTKSLKRTASANKMSVYSMIMPNESSSIIPNLKKQVGDLTQQLAQKEKEITEVKRNVKLTKISEIEVELKSYMDETIRLRRLLQQALQLKNQNEDETDGTTEEKFLGFTKEINNLKNDIQRVEQENAELSQSLAEKEKQLKEATRQSQKQAQGKSNYKRLLAEKERELEKYEDAGMLGNAAYRRVGGTMTTEGEFKIELERKIRECNNLQTSVQMRDKKLNELESKLKVQESDFEVKLINEKKKKEALLTKCEKIQNEFDELEGKYNQFLSLKPNKSSRLDTAKTQIGRSQFVETNGPETPQYQNQGKSDFASVGTPQNTSSNYGGNNFNSNQSRKKLTNAELNTLHSLSTELRARLRFNNIPFSDISKHLFTKDVIAKDEANNDDLKAVLSVEPFNVTNEEELNLLSGYLIEEPANTNMNSVYSSDERLNSQAIEEQSAFSSRMNKPTAIESAFKKLIGFYTIYSKTTHRDNFVELSRFVFEKEKQLRAQFQSGLVINRKKFDHFIKNSDYNLDASLFDFILQVSYESKQSTSLIDLQSVFIYFAGYNQNKNSSAKKQQGNDYSNEQSGRNPFDYKESRSNSDEDRSSSHKITDLQKLQSTEGENYSNGGDYVQENNNVHGKSNYGQTHAYLGTPKSQQYAADSQNNNESESGQFENRRNSGASHEAQYKKPKMPRIEEEEDVSSHYKNAREEEEEEQQQQQQQDEEQEENEQEKSIEL